MNHAKVILDIKGLVTWMYFRGEDPNGIPGQTKPINTAGFGFANFVEDVLLPILESFSPADIVAVYDGGNVYRSALYQQYKARRKADKEKEDPKQKAQRDTVESAVKSFLAYIGVVGIQVDGVEADDVIAHLCNTLDCNKIVHTVDADLLQLTSDSTSIFLRGEPVFEEHKGIPLDLIVLQKALCGDPSDNYIGVRRFGPAAWDSLVETYGWDGMRQIDQCFRSEDFGLIEECIAIDKNKILAHVYANLEDAKLCYTLATLAPELCYQFRNKKLCWPKYYARVPDYTKAARVARDMGCEFFMQKFMDIDLFPAQTLITTENSKAAISHFLKHLEETPHFAFDFETVDTLKHAAFQEAASSSSRAKQGDYVDVLSSELTGCSVTYGKHLQYTIYLSVMHRDTHNVSNQLVKDFIETAYNTGRPLIAHNAAFELQVAKQCLDYEPQKIYDTMIMSSYVDENEMSGLKFLSKTRLNYDQVSYKETLQAAGAENMAQMTGEQVLSYGCDDATVTAHLFKLFKLIMEMEQTWQFYDAQERAPVHVLNDAFDTGVRIDFDEMKLQHEKHAKIIEEGMARIREVLAERCTIADPDAAAALDEADGRNLMLLERESNIDKQTGKCKLSDSQLEARRQERKLRWEQAAIYKPYTETHVPPEFAGTPSQLKEVAGVIGFTEDQLVDFSNTRSKINKFITEVRGADLSLTQRKFCDLLAEAASCLSAVSKRNGPEFDALASFCLPYLGAGKLIVEGDELNLGSPQQKQELLYCKLALPVRLRSRPQKGSARAELGLEGSPSTNDRAIKLALAEDCEGQHAWKREILEAIDAVTTSTTLFSFYFNPYPLWAHPRDGMIHPQIKNCGTVTRRPAGNNPNILQVKKGELRRIYLPRYDHHVICALDFSGQELRIAGSEAKDPVFIDAYTGGGQYEDDGMLRTKIKDIHSVTATAFAERVFQRERVQWDGGFEYDTFMDMRNGKYGDKIREMAEYCRGNKMAKAVNFLIIYLGQPTTLSMNTGMPLKFAEQVMQQVMGTYPRLGPWQEETVEFARRYGYVRTAYGSVKHLTADIRSEDGSKRSRQERQAVNFTIQGCAADILKVVLTQAYETKLFQETGSTLIAPVYDEIVATVPAKNAFEYCQRLQDIMNLTPPGHAIPMMAEVKIGPNWGDCVELGDRPSERKIVNCIDKFARKAA